MCLLYKLYMYVMYLQSSTWRTPNRYFCALSLEPRGSLSTHWIGMENGLGRWSWTPRDGFIPTPGPQPGGFLFSVRWVFPKIGVPQNGWFIMENPIKMGWFGGKTHYFRKHPVGGWTNPLLENMLVKMGFIFPKFHFRGEKFQKYLSCHLPPGLRVSPRIA